MKLGARVLVFLFFFSCASLVFLALPTYSQYILGINDGDWALYSTEAGWRSEILGEKSAPQYYKDINNTQWKLQVENVSGVDEVRCSVTKPFNNGTEKKEIYDGNVRTGSGNLSLWIVSKGLEVGDWIDEKEFLDVNATRSLEFADALRPVIYAHYSQPESDDSIGFYGVFWDIETGILCGMSISRIRTVEEKSSIAVLSLKIVETNLWQPDSGSGFPNNMWFTGFVAVLFFLVLGVAVGISIRKRRKKKRYARHVKHSRLLHAYMSPPPLFFLDPGPCYR